ncbi:transposase [Streptomyces sp. NPDC056112]|uniref:transposase n=1 Tax=Streptomyces sp. NPDC056112 TaxID=3345715 RepID=UPI0035DE0859
MSAAPRGRRSRRGHGKATCPRGKISTRWSPASQNGTKAILVKFDKETCPVRDRCTRFKTGGRTLSLQPCELQEALDYARVQQADEQWRAKYATRADIEGPINQAVAVIGIRGARYHGLHETHLEHGKATPSTAPQPARPT